MTHTVTLSVSLSLNNIISVFKCNGILVTEKCLNIKTHVESQYESLATLHPRQTFPLLADVLPVDLLPMSNTGTHGHRTDTRPGPHQEVSVDCCIEYRLLRLGSA